MLIEVLNEFYLDNYYLNGFFRFLFFFFNDLYTPNCALVLKFLSLKLCECINLAIYSSQK